jgi:hypothetical protein
VRRAAQLLGRHADDRARATLEELRRAQPGFRLAERWLAALDARRIGRVALRGEPTHGRLAPAFWLDGQRPVWVRTASPTAAERIARETDLQRTLTIPGVALVVEHGVGSGIPYVAVAGAGQPLALDTPPALAAALALAAAAARVLHALALQGVTLPDAEPERFLHVAEPALALVLADLDGAERHDAAASFERHAVLARAFARRLVADDAIARLPSTIGIQLARALDDTASLTDVIAALDGAALRAPRD